MLLAGTTDGVYTLTEVAGPAPPVAEKVLDASDVTRLAEFDAVEGVFAATYDGLFHSVDGREWTNLSLPEAHVCSVAVHPEGDTNNAGTKPARLFEASLDASPRLDDLTWRDVSAFDERRERSDWSLPRHDDLAIVRRLCTHPDVPDRLVTGVEVGGIHVSDDRTESLETRSVSGFDAPHTDDIHHIELEDSDTLVASTGSGLYRTTDLGQTWTRLDTGHNQRYFRESFAHDESLYAGGAPFPSTSWDEKSDHALFECHDGRNLERVPSQRPKRLPAAGVQLRARYSHRRTKVRSFDGRRMVGRLQGRFPTPRRCSIGIFH
ncbi:WD40 repeat domain-containing protein [Haladaptatus sp. YSMS36]|uniref:WD40/YVTN/BNR-like repeat-containing protein n=1 Tax=Haladaptatus sp. YSMS36 TaxID=3033384 RepID=UPI0023E83516|nr:WD40 repeat domain-containing protein [Haladaptatus sp. YSMS36]